MVTELQKEHLDEYVIRYDYEGIESIQDTGLVFEAMSEMIVELNESYKIEKLCEEFLSKDMEPQEFFELKLDRVLSDSVKDVISIAHYNMWVDYSINGLNEYKSLHLD